MRSSSSKTIDENGPSLKAEISHFIFQGPEGPCSLRENESAAD
jgi:hypothetical protein